MPIITTELVRLDADLGSTTTDVITALAGLVHGAGRASSASLLADAALAREAQNPTGVPGRVAIPHCRSEAVAEPTLAFARLSRPVNFGGPDGDSDLVFLIAAPEGGGKTHLKILSKLARALVRGDFIDRLRSAATADDIVAAVTDVVGEAGVEKQADQPAAAPAPAPGEKVTRIVAVTA